MISDPNQGANAMQTCELENIFLSAEDKGFLKPTLRTESFIFSLAPRTGKNPGTVYVTDRVTKIYLGKIKNNWFWPSRDYQDSPQTREHILAVLQAPRGEAVKYGVQTGQCSICGRGLTNKISIFNKIGPICAEKMGWLIETPPEETLDLDMI